MTLIPKLLVLEPDEERTYYPTEVGEKKFFFYSRLSSFYRNLIKPIILISAMKIVLIVHLPF